MLTTIAEIGACADTPKARDHVAGEMLDAGELMCSVCVRRPAIEIMPPHGDWARCGPCGQAAPAGEETGEFPRGLRA